MTKICRYSGSFLLSHVPAADARLSIMQANRPPFSGFSLVTDYRGDCASAAARFLFFARFFRLSPAYLSTVQAIRPPFSFSSFRKRKRSPAAKRKRALSMNCPKGPFNRAFCKPQVHTGHRLKAYAPFRTLSRLLWQFVQLGKVTNCSTSCGGTLKKIRRAASANPGESKGAAHGPLCRFN